MLWSAACAGGSPAPPPAAPPDPPRASPADDPSLAVTPGPTLTAGPTLSGLCDLSAGALVDDRWLLGVDDEANILHVFDMQNHGRAGPPVALQDLSPLFSGPEADLEGAAWLDGRLWVIASHDAGRSTHRRASRQRLFALDVTATNTGVSVALVGVTEGLLEGATALPTWAAFVPDTQGKTSKDPRGLSIEGLAPGGDGSLLIGFRNPIVDGKAAVVALDNPDALLTGAAPALRGPFWIDLGGRGIRSLERRGDLLWIIAGPGEPATGAALFSWDGPGSPDPPEDLAVDLGDLRPEGLVAGPERWWVLSDDGGLTITHDVECKDLPRSAQAARTATVPR